MTRQTERGNDSPASSTEGTGTSRRALLRRGSVALAGGVGWVATGSDVVRANSCPRPMSYWRDHPDEWPTFTDDAFFLIRDEAGGGVLRQPNDYQDRLLSLLEEPPDGDVYLRLVKQYIAARLNRKDFAPHPDTYDDFWDRAASYHRWTRDAARPQTEWEVSGIDGEALHDYFWRWNNGIGWWCEWKFDPPEGGDPRKL